MQLVDAAVGEEETEGKIWSPRKKIIKRERTIEAPRCHIKGYREETVRRIS